MRFVQKFVVSLNNSEINQKIAYGASWSILGTVVARILMLAASIWIARILNKYDYGQLGIIRSTANMFIVFGGFGLGMTASKFIAENFGENKAKLSNIIGLTTSFSWLTNILILCGVILGAPLISNIINAPNLITEIRISSAILFFSGLNGAQAGILNGFQAFKINAKISAISAIISFPLQIAFTYFFGLKGAIIGLAFNFFLLWLLTKIEIIKLLKEKNIQVCVVESYREWRVLLNFSLPSLLAGFLVTPVIWYCNTMLVNQPQGFEEMAIFSAANQWRISILFIPGILSKIVLPLLSMNLNNKNDYFKIVKINIAINLIICLLMTVFVAVFSKSIMGFYGSDFEEGRFVLILLVASTIFISINNVIGQVIASKNKMWQGFFLNLLWAVAIIATTKFFLYSGYGAFGLACGFFVSYIAHTIFQVFYVKGILIKNKL